MKGFCNCGQVSDLKSTKKCKSCRSKANRNRYLKKVPNAYFGGKKPKDPIIKIGLIDSLNNEVWKDVVFYVGMYSVSNLGRIKSNSREVGFINRWGQKSIRIIKEKLLTQTVSHKGYLRVHLHNNSESKAWSVHRVVCLAFHENPFDFPSINHEDGNKINNNAINLKWCTHSYNQQHAVNTGLHIAKSGFEDNQSKGVKRVFNGQVFGSITIASKFLSLPKTTLSRALRTGKEIYRGKFKGEKFEYYAHTL